MPWPSVYIAVVYETFLRVVLYAAVHMYSPRRKMPGRRPLWFCVMLPHTAGRFGMAGGAPSPVALLAL